MRAELGTFLVFGTCFLPYVLGSSYASTLGFSFGLLVVRRFLVVKRLEYIYIFSDESVNFLVNSGLVLSAFTSVIKWLFMRTPSRCILQFLLLLLLLHHYSDFFK